MILIGIALIAGLLIGLYLPWSISAEFAPLFSVAIMACLDSVFGGVKAHMEKQFNNLVFFSGFFANAMLASLFVFIGVRIGIDIYYVALLSFGLRIFDNTAAIRRIWLNQRKNNGIEGSELYRNSVK